MPGGATTSLTRPLALPRRDPLESALRTQGVGPTVSQAQCPAQGTGLEGVGPASTEAKAQGRVATLTGGLLVWTGSTKSVFLTTVVQAHPSMSPITFSGTLEVVSSFLSCSDDFAS